MAEQPAWHFKYADQFEEHGVGIGLQAAAVAASINDSRHVGYTIGTWLHSVREHSLGCTGQAQVIKHGTGDMIFDLPVFTPPAPPEGLAAVLPGALDRIFRFIRIIKAAPGYTRCIGLLMAIVGREVTQSDSEAGQGMRPSLNQVPDMQKVVLKFIKDGHQGVWIEGRRAGSPWEVPHHHHPQPLHRQPSAAGARPDRGARIPRHVLGPKPAPRRLVRRGEDHRLAVALCAQTE